MAMSSARWVGGVGSFGWAGVVAAWVLALSACSSTTLESSYLDKGYTGGPRQKVLVVGLAREEGARRQFENAFATGILLLYLLLVAMHP